MFTGKKHQLHYKFGSFSMLSVSCPSCLYKEYKTVNQLANQPEVLYLQFLHGFKKLFNLVCVLPS